MDFLLKTCQKCCFVFFNQRYLKLNSFGYNMYPTVHLFLRSSHIHTYLMKQVKNKITVFTDRKCVNLMLPESAEVDRQHQPSDQDRDKRRWEVTLAKSAKKG